MNLPEQVDDPTDARFEHYRSSDPAVCVLTVRMRPLLYDAFYTVTRQQGLTISQGIRRLVQGVVQGRLTI